jgi:phospholipid/cholesterol/gamma-HCH transport system permease protein
VRTNERSLTPPTLAPAGTDSGRLLLAGDWVMAHGPTLEQLLSEAESASRGRGVRLDLSGIHGFDTLGALVVHRISIALGEGDKPAIVEGLSEEKALLLKEVGIPSAPGKRRNGFSFVDLLADIGGAIVEFGKDMVAGVSFLGGLVAALGRVALRPATFRLPAFVTQIEAFGFRSVPIIALISFLVGGIIAQQSVFQLRTFGTTAFVADLLGILVLRELGVLLTAIMIAGRSGSAITAEIGSMKMREEIDALRTMGVDPMEVLIAPRVLALIVCMPLLTFMASMSGIFGGGIVAWLYGDVSPDVFLSRLQNAIGFNTFMVGMIKAPVMALVIGLIASIEGMAVKGSAESLGRQTTASVVKSIFMVIVVDGLFAMFFASIRY